MKKLIFYIPQFIALGFLLSIQSVAEAQQPATRPQKCVFIIVDGIPSDVIEKVATPALDIIAKQGRYLRATVGGKKDTYSETPTISAVGYNSLLTGTWANKHNVWDNDIKKPNYSYPTIFRLLKDQDPQKKIAIFSTWEDNRTKLIGEGLETTRKIRMDFAFDGLEKDTVNYPHDTDAQYIRLIDEAVVNQAAATILKEGPDLSWIYLEYTDDMGHRYGDSERFYESVKMMDTQIARIWKAINNRAGEFKEDWQIYITTDHGRDSISGKGHGRQSARERSTWIVTNAIDVNPYFSSNKPAIVDIMPAIARHLRIDIPRPQKMELDGISLTGKLSVSNVSATRNDEKLQVKWHAIETAGNAKIWIATGNNYAQGKMDNYELAATVPLNAGQVIIDVSRYKSAIYKVVVEGRHNMANCWVK